MVELQTGDSFAIGHYRWLCEFAHLSPVYESFHDVLLDVEIIVGNSGHLLAQLRQVLDAFSYPIISHVVGSRFSSQDNVVTNVLLDEAVAVMTANHRVWQIEILDHSLQLAAVVSGDFPAEDSSDLIRLADVAVLIQQPLLHRIESRPAPEDEIVTVLHLCEEQVVLTANLPFFRFEERGKGRQPLPATTQQILCRE